MTLQFQKRKRVGNTGVNLSKSGVSLSRRAGPLTVSTRGRASVRIMPGVSWRLGKNQTGAAALVMLALSLCFLALWLSWATIRLTWLAVSLPTRWALRKLAARNAESAPTTRR